MRGRGGEGVILGWVSRIGWRGHSIGRGGQWSVERVEREGGRQMKREGGKM